MKTRVEDTGAGFWAGNDGATAPLANDSLTILTTEGSIAGTPYYMAPEQLWVRLSFTAPGERGRCRPGGIAPEWSADGKELYNPDSRGMAAFCKVFPVEYKDSDNVQSPV